MPPLIPSAPDGSNSELEVVLHATIVRLVIDGCANQLDALAYATEVYMAAVGEREARREERAAPKKKWRWPWSDE